MRLYRDWLLSLTAVGIRIDYFYAGVKGVMDQKFIENVKLVNDNLDTHFKRLIAQRKIRSAAYCIAKNGSIISCHAMGAMDLGNGMERGIDTDTIFEIQSVTKWITAAAILILQERGELSLADRAGHYIEELSETPFSEITVLHLLTHTSGLVPLEGTFPDRDLHWQAYVDEGDVAGSWIPAVLKMGLSHRPGSRWEYSMVGFCLLGEIIARITGEQAEDFIRREILLPCGMRETHWKREITPEWAKRYQVRTERHRQQYASAQDQGERAWIDYCAGWREIPETAGGLMSTLKDVIRFGNMLAEGGSCGGRQILQESSLLLFEKNQLEPGARDFCWGHGGVPFVYGAGCAVYDPSYEQALRLGEHTMYHEGTGPCMLMVNRKEKLAAVWDAPFWTEREWYAEPVRDTANIIWADFITRK